MLVQVELGPDPLNKVSGSSLVDEKKMWLGGETRDPTKSGQLGSLIEISW